MGKLNEFSKLGFGLLRLPQKEDGFDKELINSMVDKYMASGFNYFDTAYTYEGSENAAKEALVSRYPREDYVFATKMFIPIGTKKTDEEKEEYFKEQLSRTGLDYFDCYLLHGVTAEEHYNAYVNSKAFEFCQKKKEEGKIKYFGFSFHGDPKLLVKMLDENPTVDFVQIQVNYADWDSELVYSGELYRILYERKIPIMVMEPVKGGTLVNLSPEIEELFKKENPDNSAASWALRFVASLDGVVTVLSGMSNFEQVEDNLKTFTDFKPLSEREKEVIDEAVKILFSLNRIPCTDCKYCVKGCPKKINIPEVFKLSNAIRRTPNDGVTKMYYSQVPKEQNASACINCRKCEKACPQHLNITGYLKETVADFS